MSSNCRSMGRGSVDRSRLVSPVGTSWQTERCAYVARSEDIGQERDPLPYTQPLITSL